MLNLYISYASVLGQLLPKCITYYQLHVCAVHCFYGTLTKKAAEVQAGIIKRKKPLSLYRSPGLIWSSLTIKPLTIIQKIVYHHFFTHALSSAAFRKQLESSCHKKRNCMSVRANWPNLNWKRLQYSRALPVVRAGQKHFHVAGKNITKNKRTQQLRAGRAENTPPVKINDVFVR